MRGGVLHFVSGAELQRPECFTANLPLLYILVAPGQWFIDKLN